MSRLLPATPENVERAAALLREGGVVAFPTETVYGLGAAARQPAAVARVYELKGRPRGHPLIVHLPAASHLDAWAEEVPPAARELARRFWPGPLTLVLRREGGVPDAVTGGQDTVALRVPGHPVALALLAAFGDGVAAPSANRFGRISPTLAAHVAEEFDDPALVVLDGGPSDVGVESTILDLSDLERAGEARLLRPGGVSRAELEAVLGQRPLLPGEARAAVPRAPGGLKSHYAPTAPTRLVAADELLALAGALPGAAVLARRPAPAGFAGAWRALPADPAGYARGLYAALRELDAAAPRVILVEAPPAGEAWLAVRDRLARAAADERGDDGP